MPSLIALEQLYLMKTNRNYDKLAQALDLWIINILAAYPFKSLLNFVAGDPCCLFELIVVLVFLASHFTVLSRATLRGLIDLHAVQYMHTAFAAEGIARIERSGRWQRVRVQVSAW